MATAILSPHLDDAVLSCWHLLTQPGDVTVINVFAGVPGPAAHGWWDQYTGATDSAERVRARVKEDRRALALAGRTPVNLDLLDEQYRDGEQPLDPPTRQIAAAIASDDQIYAPAAFAGHPDHLLVRAAALELLAEGHAISLYADLPHATINGWPTWVRPTSSPRAKDTATAMWDRTLATTGIPSGAMVPEVCELDAETYAGKVSAVRTYETQAQMLAELMGQPLSDPQWLGYEVVWTLPPATSARADRAGGRAAARH